MSRLFRNCVSFLTNKKQGKERRGTYGMRSDVSSNRILIDCLLWMRDDSASCGVIQTRLSFSAFSIVFFLDDYDDAHIFD
ncbi:Uncharacterized protein APZ42_025974 [Daphnia magna]|uniref:Uncharacterized protein n=1 Tax=Daphnia magna TaxID=35525 RepID=A0A164SL69_9CRUS|nr:Uncharacterized protein APZ42_025974 [Daphnia magna]